MQTFNIWHKFDLHGSKIAFLLLLGFLLCGTSGYAQRNVEVNNPNYDNRFLSYGFLIGVHTSAYQLKYSEKFTSEELDDVYSISPTWSAGFTLGFIVNLNLADYLDARLLPQVSFYEHNLEYVRLVNPNVDELVETTVVEFPLLLKYKSARRGNARMYFVGGIKPGIEASGKNDIDEVSKDNINIKSFNTSLDVGFGLDIYYPLFKFSPEIRFSRGITNMLGNDANFFSEGIDRLNTNTITLYLLFQ
ncbi:PorT family protein [Fulvivirga sp. RKSG066]|uniref:type IX secretion/gliding motility protein PorT/SprT n=1 Tax=Fulvivirga aurantia TaxID=2529383 RepID=UPI0012BC1B78|nr:porin family protein [Fulvivirga aurantia]MTI21031.1 PorT family protein [Fulvivirga aurantia]